MLHRIRRVLGKYLSRGEKGALKLFLLERKMARCHSAGLKKIRRENLQHPQKLNLGCGPHRKEGFLNVDLFPPAEVTLDLRRGLPFDSGCCDLIFSEHCFEHFDYPETILHLLRECHRVLRAGGGASLQCARYRMALERLSGGGGRFVFQGLPGKLLASKVVHDTAGAHKLSFQARDRTPVCL